MGFPRLRLVSILLLLRKKFLTNASVRFEILEPAVCVPYPHGVVPEAFCAQLRSLIA